MWEVCLHSGHVYRNLHNQREINKVIVIVKPWPWEAASAVESILPEDSVLSRSLHEGVATLRDKHGKWRHEFRA